MTIKWLGPLIELAGYSFMTAAFVFGAVSQAAMLVLLLPAVGFGTLLSVTGPLMEEASSICTRNRTRRWRYSPPCSSRTSAIASSCRGGG